MSGWDDMFEHLEENPDCSDVVLKIGDDIEVAIAKLILDNMENQHPYVLVDDPVRRRIGFRNMETQQALWLGVCLMREIRPCFILKLLTTRAGRQKLVSWISAGAVPNMSEADRNRITDRIGEPLSSLFEPDPE